MPASSLSRAALQARADLIEDATGAIAREMFKVQIVALGQPLARAEEILAGRDAEYVLVHPRALAEPHVRAAVDRALKIGRRR
ncbi:hypothetical protein SEA_LILMAC1015_41 [Arthrobacter phage Lilmac1015]|uniref:Uncharacterized protein n=1 Tax=Arthrobacter phage Lilmac1015 TaxID=2912653 RepID=A0AA49BPT3_9CAUD|nr:hypothetical protein SEA_LILMAC1015_41 [Arthrobacter phage Lilmac1015]